MFLLPRARAPLLIRDKPLRAKLTIRGYGSGTIVSADFHRDGRGRTKLTYFDSNAVPIFAIATDPVEQLITHFEFEEPVLKVPITAETATPKLNEWTYVDVHAEISTVEKVLHGLRCRHVDFFTCDTHERRGDSWIAFDDGLVVRDTDPKEEALWEVVAV